MRLAALIALAFVLVRSVSATIPATNQIPWTVGTYAGVPTGIVARTTIYTNWLASYGSAALNDAIANCPSGQVIQFETNATHMITNTIVIPHNKDSITLRGGAFPWHCKWMWSNNAFLNIGSDSDYLHAYPTATNQITSWTAVHKGTTNIIVTNVTDFAVGKMVRISVQNDTNAVFTTGAGEYLRRENKVIHAVSGNQVTVWPPMYSGYESGSMKICTLYQFQTDFVGIEGIWMDWTNNTGQTIAYNQSYGCWISNCVVTNFYGHAINVTDSLMCEFRNVVVRNRTGDGANGSGILPTSSTALAIEDCYFDGVCPGIELWGGSSGNVIGYSFFWDARILTTIGGALNINHGSYNQWNLIEGCLFPFIQNDGYFNGSSYNTVFKNWGFGLEPTFSPPMAPFSWNRGAHYMGVEGNVWGVSTNTWSSAFGMGGCCIGGGADIGIADQVNADYWTNSSAIGVVTNRTDNDTTEIQILNPARLVGITDNWWPISVGQVQALPSLTAIGYVGTWAIQMTLTNLNLSSGNFKLENHNAGQGDFPANGTQVSIYFGPNAYTENDHSVSNTIYRAENYYYGEGIPAAEQTGLTAGSLYRTVKHVSWPSGYNIAAINTADPPDSADLFTAPISPAHYYFINGNWPTDAGGPVASGTPPAIGIKGVNLRAR